MPRLAHVTFRYVDDPVLSDVLLHITPGWTGLVGANGAGKTTLLRLITGDLTPSAGTVQRPDHVLLCPQRVEHRSPAIDGFAEDWSRLACRWRGRLALDPVDLERWPTLSPGQRKRWQIGAALVAEPEVLLLDEPTNHLDTETRERLLEALRSFKGTGVVVSHDRAFLDALTTSTVWVERGSVRHWPLPCTEAEAQREREAAEALDRLQTAQSEARRAKQHLTRARGTLAAAERNMSVKGRRRNAGDREASSLGAKIRAARGQARQAHGVALGRDRLARKVEALDQLERPDDLGRTVFVDYEPPRRTTLLSLQCATLEAGSTVLLRDVDVSVRPGDRIHLVGPNGSGKTTLLSALLSGHALGDRVLYVPQELDEATGRSLLATLRELPAGDRGRTLQGVAALGTDPARLLATDHPSPGEARKLAIALGLARHAWLVVLDEPTNHLDLPSIRRLGAALESFPGALLLITHDAALAAGCTTERWVLEGGRIRW